MVFGHLFGASREEMWRKLSAELQGRYVQGSFWKGDRVEAAHGPWLVTLDQHAVSTGDVVLVYTRLRAPFVNASGFRFRIYRKSVLSALGKALGMQDIEIGDAAFDDAFVIQGNDDAKVRALFSSPRIRSLLSAQKDVEFGIRDDEGFFGPKFPEGTDELRFLASGVVRDLEALRGLYELFAEVLDELCRMGVAYNVDPHVTL